MNRARMTAPGFLPLLRQAMTGHAGWAPLWKTGPRRASHDVIVVGGGPLGLLTAWGLARDGAVGDVALVTAGPVGGLPVAPDLPLHGLCIEPGLSRLAAEGAALWRGLDERLAYGTGLEERPAVVLGHNEDDRHRAARALYAALAAGHRVEDVPLPRDDHPLAGQGVVLRQTDAGTVAADPLVFGLARAAGRAGVDLIPERPVTGLAVDAGRVIGVETAEGLLRARKVVLAGPEGVDLAGTALTVVRRRVLVSEPLTPCLDSTILWRDLMLSQAERGEIVVRGDGPVEALAARAVAALPRLSRLRVGHWGEEAWVTGRLGAPLIGPLEPTGLHALALGDMAMAWPAAVDRLSAVLAGRPLADTALAG